MNHVIVILPGRTGKKRFFLGLLGFPWVV